MRARSLTTLAAVLCFPAIASAQLLNPSFETPGAGGRAFANWDQFGGNIYRIDDFNYQQAWDGDALGKIFGNFDGQPQSDSGIYQFLPAAGGEQWTGSIYVLHRGDDALAGANLGLLVMSWQDSNGAEISSDAQVLLDANTPTDEWLYYEVSAEAPGGTARIGYYLLFLQFADDNFPFGAPGAMFFDLASLEKTGDACVADFNGDGVVDTRDVLAFLNAWNDKDSEADIDDNGTIDTRDVLAYLNLWNVGC